MKKICVVTGSRAEYGFLKGLLKKIKEDDELELQIIATGTHLSKFHGETYKEILEDKFIITEEIDILLQSDDQAAISKSIGLAMLLFPQAYHRLNPDIILIAGDRFESFAAMLVASVLEIPIVHLYGGETTQGAVDEVFRHCMTKMANLHFTATEEYRKRVIQLGEDPLRVFYVGSLGVEQINHTTLMSKSSIEKALDFAIDTNTILVTYHPETRDAATGANQICPLLSVIEHRKDLRVIFTKANADTNGNEVNKFIEEFVSKHNERCALFDSLGTIKYYSVMSMFDVFVGNSSSGIIEAPSFKTAVINIGNRQKGRISAISTLHVQNDSTEIDEALSKIITNSHQEYFDQCYNPYEKENTADCIIQKIKEHTKMEHLTKKVFFGSAV